MTKKKPDPGTIYRQAVAEVPEARKRWAQAELAWHACADPRRTGRMFPDCACGGCADKVDLAREAVGFAQACVIAAGENVKGVSFAEASANPTRPIEVPA